MKKLPDLIAQALIIGVVLGAIKYVLAMIGGPAAKAASFLG